MAKPQNNVHADFHCGKRTHYPMVDLKSTPSHDVFYFLLVTCMLPRLTIKRCAIIEQIQGSVCLGLCAYSQYIELD